MPRAAIPVGRPCRHLVAGTGLAAEPADDDAEQAVAQREDRVPRNDGTGCLFSIRAIDVETAVATS